MPTAPTSSSEFTDLLKKSGLIPPDKVASLSDLGLPAEPQKAAAKLVAQGLITRFQAQQLLAGRHKGFRVGGYVIQDMLGRGGMGAVYLAEHVELNRKVAVKVLVPGRDEDQKLALERFLREARAAAALDHPNIVRIFDVSRHNDVPYLVMEYVEGETLQQVLDRDGAVPYPTATEYIAQAAAGLQHAHEKGFIHRDIKPGNLMRDKTGTVKILDMGLARAANGTDNLTERLDNGAVVGTADFIAPEQALNQPNIDCRADIYSLGATFFALIIGKPPFEGNTTQKLLQHQLRSAPRIGALDATLPKGLSAVVARMLAKKPEDRYQSPAEVIAALAPWMGNSARILAGISRTNLGQGADLQATLSEINRGAKSRRLRKSKEDDSDEVNVEGAGHETGAVASAITTRAHPQQKKKKKRHAQKERQKRILIYVAAAVGVSMLGVLGAWAAMSGSKKTETPDNRSRQEQEQNLPPKGNSGTPRVEYAKEKILYRLDAAKIPVFKNTKLGRAITSGDEDPKVKGVYFGGWKEQSVSEWKCDTVAGSRAVGYTNVSEVNSAQIGLELEQATGLGLRFEPGQRVRLRIEYRTAGRGRGHAYFQTYDDWKVPDRVDLPNSNSQWSSVDLVTTRGDRPLRCVIDTSETGAGNTLFVRSATISDAGKGNPVSRANPQPAGPDLSKWTEGKSIYALDLTKIPEFRVVKEQFNRTSGEPERLPTGTGCHCWKEGAIGEFRCEKIDGALALGVTNLNDEKSGQFHFELEKEMKLPLVPGKAYRVKISYMTKNDAAGVSYVQITPGYAAIGTAPMPNTAGKWKDTSGSFTRPPLSDNVEVRMVIDNNTVGEGNTVLFRSLEIVELNPPKK